MTSPVRLLGPPIAVVFLAGVAAAATYDDTTADARADDGAIATTTTTSTLPVVAGVTTTTSVGGSTSSVPPPASTTAPATSPVPPATTSPPSQPPAAAEPADLIVHVSGAEVVGVAIENAGPGQAPGITVELSGVDGLEANQILVGAGVDCFGDGTVTCTVAATGIGDRVGELEVPLPAGACLDVVVRSEVEDPVPEDNHRRHGDC